MGAGSVFLRRGKFDALLQASTERGQELPGPFFAVRAKAICSRIGPLARFKGHYKPNAGTQCPLFLLELDPAARLPVVDVDFALLGTRVSEVDGKPVSRRAQLTGLHGGPGEVLLVVIFGVQLYILADDERPFLFARDDVHGVAAGWDGRISEDKVGFGEESHCGATGHHRLARGRAIVVPDGNGVVASGDLFAIFKGADGSLGIRIRRRGRGLVSSCKGREQKST